MEKRTAWGRDQTEGRACLMSNSDLQSSDGILMERPLAFRSPCSHLPTAVLAQVLQLVPQQQRMYSCAVVSKAWKAAAAAGTVSVACNGLSEASLKLWALEAWLRKQGHQLTELSATIACTHGVARSGAQLWLPCAELPQLARLDLTGLQPLLMSDLTPRWSGLNPASSPVTVESGLPMLRELRLSNLTISKPYSIAQLTQLSGLTLLALFDVTLASAVGAAGKPTASQALNNAVPALLEHLPRLEHLDLNYLLSELTANAVAATSSSLTRLSVSPSGQSTHGQPLAREPPISVVQLVQLQHLDIRHAVLDPAALANLLQLRRLHMQHCRLAPGAQSASVAAATGDQAILLLQSVGGMQHLQHLSLINVDLQANHRGLAFAATQPHRLSALTASSQLTSLEVWADMDVPLPPAAVQYMFPAGRRLERLKELVLASDCRDGTARACMSVADLQYIVSACPALCLLNLSSGVSTGAGDISTLLQLPATCQSLCVAGTAFSDEAAGIIGQLTQLTNLTWMEMPGLSDAGLHQLTALQGLQEFCIIDMDRLSAEVQQVAPEYARVCGSSYLIMSAESSNMPVWQQLREMLDKSPANISWARRMEQQQQDISRLQQQVAQLQRRNAALEQQWDAVQGHH